MITLLYDVRFWSLIVASIMAGLTIVGLIIKKASTAKVIENDMKYLKEDLANIKEDIRNNHKYVIEGQSNILDKINKIEKSQFAMKIICDERHGINRREA